MRKATPILSIHRILFGCICVISGVIVMESYFQSVINRMHAAENARVMGEIGSLINQTKNELKLLGPSNHPVSLTAEGSTSRDSGITPTPQNVRNVPDITGKVPKRSNPPHLQPQERVPDVVLKWHTSLRYVMSCVLNYHGGLYFYHTRKAAGTTIRDWLEAIGRQYRIRSFESEGISLNSKIFDVRNLLSVTAIRHPIDRILSLYWYEHVAWWLDIKHDMSKCRPLHAWVDAWRDGNSFKDSFVQKYPGTVYVEIENYYVKSLIGWRGGQLPLTEKDFELAKERLSQFHIVFISEWMSNSNTSLFLQNLFQRTRDHPGGTLFSQLQKSSNKGQPNNKKQYPRLEEKKDEVVRLLTEINAFDLRLYEYAQSLWMDRLQYVLSDSAIQSNGEAKLGVSADSTCAGDIIDMAPDLKRSIGLFQPPGHKGP